MTNSSSTDATIARADRLSGAKSSLMLALSRQAAEMKARGQQIINLSAGIPDYPAPAFLLQAGTSAIDSGRNGYGDPRGVPELRRAVAAHVQQTSGLDYDPDQEVTITAGASAALQAALLAFVNPGDEVAFLEPYYETYLGLIALAGGSARRVRLAAPDFRITEELLAATFTAATRVFILNTPHNPSGRVFSRAELELLASYCRRFNVLVLADEAYAAFVFDGDHTSIATLPGMRERTATIGSISKTFNVAGWRVGEVVAPAAITAALRQVNDLTLGAPVPFQHACVQALAQYDAYVSEAQAFHRPLRDELTRALAAAGLVPYPAEGTLAILADAGAINWQPGTTPVEMLLQAGILSLPAAAFYQGEAPPVLRFSFCRTDAEIGRASQALAKAAS